MLKNTRMKNRIIWYDFETNGLNPYHNQIIEIFAIDNDNQTFHRLVKTPQPLDPRITELTKITDSMLVGYGVDVNDAIRDFRDFLVRGIDKRYSHTFLVAHNGDSFDRLFLKTATNKAGCPLPHSSFQYIDTLHLARMVAPQLYNHRLSTIANYFGIKVEGDFHRAEADVRVLRSVYSYLTTRFRSEGKNEIESIVDVFNAIYF